MDTKPDHVFDDAARYLGLTTAVLAVVYAVAYLIGYFYLRSFYDELGAVWALDLYGTVAIAQVPSIVAVLLVFGGLNLATNSEVIEHSSWKLTAVLTVLTLLTGVAHWSVGRFMPGYVSHFIIAIYVFGFLALLSGAATYGKEVVRKQGRRRGMLVLAFFGLVVGFAGAPILGEWNAKRMKSSVGVDLPLVVLDAEGDHHWRLVAAVPNEKLLLIQFVAGKAPVFRVVATTEPVAVFTSGPRARHDGWTTVLPQSRANP